MKKLDIQEYILSQTELIKHLLTYFSTIWTQMQECLYVLTVA